MSVARDKADLALFGALRSESDPFETSAVAADVECGQSLFHYQMLRGRSRGRRGRGNGERQKRIPSRRTVGCAEFAVSPQAQEALHVTNRKTISDLRTDTENA